MGTFLYSPGVRVSIETTKAGTIEVTDDIARGTLALQENAPAQLSLSITNARRKYDGLFTPNDRISVRMKRITWLQVFSGYLGAVPFFSTYPRTITLSAMDSLKRLKYHPWDAGAVESWNLLHTIGQGQDGMNDVDGGMGAKIKVLLTDVAGWPSTQIHLGRLPDQWFERISDLFRKVSSTIQVDQSSLGLSSTIAGQTPLDNGTTTLAPIPGHETTTGTLPASSGKASWFAGPNDPGAWGTMGVSGESGKTPRDDWYCAMRFPYIGTHAVSGMPVGDVDEIARQWWAKQKVLVVNPLNNQAVVLRCADWGPRGDLGRVIDMSQRALDQVLGASTDSTVLIRFAAPDAMLGPATATQAAAAGVTGRTALSANWTIRMRNPAVSDLAWGGYSNGEIPASALRQVNDTIYDLFPPASVSAETMVAVALRDGVRLSITDAYRDLQGQKAAKADADRVGRSYPAPGQSMAGWGMAVEFAMAGGTSDPAYRWLHDNAADFGWVNSTALTRRANSTADDVIAEARQWVKEAVPYVYGGRTKQGADCSGFIQAIFASQGVTLGRTTVDQYAQGTVVPLGGSDPLANAQPGDVVFFGMTNAGLDHQHEGLYIGGGQMINELHTGLPARVDTVWTTGDEPLSGIRRYISADPNAGAGEPAEPWHWEFLAAANFVRNGEYDPLGFPPQTDGSTSASSNNLLNAYNWYGAPDPNSEVLAGPRALMNDEPVLNTAAMLANTSMRSFMAAPNGDFIAWFPDYFGVYGTAGKMVVQPIEIMGDGFTVMWDDERLVTHQFTAGSPTGFSTGALPGGAVTIYQQYMTLGIATVEFPELMQALFNINAGDPRAAAFLDKDAILRRFGARPNFTPMGTITGPQAEFWYACWLFQQNWAAQFSSAVPLTFMPEVFPGMLLQLPTYGFQCYVEAVQHSFDFGPNGGFTTQVRIIAPSATDGSGLYALPRAA